MRQISLLVAILSKVWLAFSTSRLSLPKQNLLLFDSVREALVWQVIHLVGPSLLTLYCHISYAIFPNLSNRRRQPDLQNISFLSGQSLFLSLLRGSGSFKTFFFKVEKVAHAAIKSAETFDPLPEEKISLIYKGFVLSLSNS